MAASFPILQTKLHIPRLRANRVPRPRLTDRLDEGLASGLIVVSASAGSGKTTLLAEWIEHRQQMAGRSRESFAWLWLEDADNDPTRFLAYLLAALQRIDPNLGEDPFEAVQSPQPPSLDAMLVELLNDIATLPQRVILIIDDCHTIRAAPIHAALGYLAEHLPENLALVIASRSDPPLPLTRLRARGQVAELRQEDLRFTPDEAVQFLNQAMGLALTPEQVAVLEQRTEGWAAGLQMAAVSLRGREDAGAFIESFSSSHRFVLDYLLEEALNRQSTEVQAFLLQTSVLDRLCAPLCAAVIDPAGQGDAPSAVGAQAIIEQLERSNLFIIPLDNQRRWYRYHHLFAGLLRQQLEIAPRKAGLPVLPSPAVLHGRAGAWYASQGLLPDAIEHCLTARDYPAAADLVAAAADEMLRYSELATLLSWLEALPEAVIAARPDLCMYHALALVISWQSLERVNSRLQRALAGDLPAPLAAVTHALDSVIASFQGDVARGVARSQQALALLSDPSSFLGSLTISLLGLAYIFSGNAPGVQPSLEQALEISAQAGNLFAATMLRSQMADMYVFEGYLHKGYDLYQETLRQGVDRRGQTLPVAGLAYLGLGEVQREWNDLTQAEILVKRGLDLTRRWGEATAIDGYLALAKIEQANGDPGAARAFIERAAAFARRFDASDIDDRMVGAHAARLLTYQGDLDGARRWLEKSGIDLDGSPAAVLLKTEAAGSAFPNLYLYELEWTAAARLLLQMGRIEQALEITNALLPIAETGGHLRTRAENLILSGLAYFQLGDEARTLSALGRAVEITASEGFVRLFVDEALGRTAGINGAGLAALLRRLPARASQETAGYIDQLLAAILTAAAGGSAIPAAPPELLSVRELEVLHCLAAGMANEEIAGRLTVAVSTVKSHVHNILNKLSASSRLAAVQRARELGLIK